MRSKPPDPGYDEPFPGESFEPVEFRVEEYNEMFVTLGRLVSVTRNGEPVGSIRVKTEEEIEWIKERLEGTFIPGDESD